MMDSWFRAAFNFVERDYTQAKAMFLKMYDPASNTLGAMPLGHWRFSSLGELRHDGLALLRDAATAGSVAPGPPTLSFSHDVGDARALHARHPGAMFQAASQYNCLEFVSPQCTPLMGITIYAHDHTQGPACAIACPAATAFRNYLVPMPDGTTGQTEDSQLDGLADLGAHLGNTNDTFWDMVNGYVDSSTRRLERLNTRLSQESDREHAKSLVRIGTHFHTFATPARGGSGGGGAAAAAAAAPVLVGQAFCAATAVAYSRVPYEKRALWRDFSELVLESEYEATLWAAILNHYTTADASARPEAVTVFLTKLGGGVFGNEAEWVAGSLRRAVESVLGHLAGAGAAVALDLHLVHYREVEEEYEVWLQGLGEEEEGEEGGVEEAEEEEEVVEVIEVSPSPSPSPPPSPTEKKKKKKQKEEEEEEDAARSLKRKASCTSGEKAAAAAGQQRQRRRRKKSKDGEHELTTEGSSLFLPIEL